MDYNIIVDWSAWGFSVRKLPIFRHVKVHIGPLQVLFIKLEGGH